jgi:hypothetical protein
MVKGLSINDVTALGGGGMKDFVTTVALSLKIVTMGGGGVKIIKKSVTSFMDDPKVQKNSKHSLDFFHQ